jgi:uncharacterized protein YprB with RNaseH-like and TPR domain
MHPKPSFTPGAFLHLPGFGPKKVEALKSRGIACWSDLLHHHHLDLPGLEDSAPEWVKQIWRDEQAITTNNLGHLVNTLHRSDHWRILADFLDQATYLDIETSGDQQRPEITLIIAKHKGCLHTYTAEHNLDDFLHLLDDITMLVTFNGASFDVPQMENHFHIPLRDIAHIDLRWVCYHTQMRGGLKEIERAIGLIRPADLIGMDGAEADWIWQRWKVTGNPALLKRLTRYCAADVIGLEHLSRWLIAHLGGTPFPVFHWDGLPGESDTPAPTPLRSPVESTTEKRLRERLRASLSVDGAAR